MPGHYSCPEGWELFRALAVLAINPGQHLVLVLLYRSMLLFALSIASACRVWPPSTPTECQVRVLSVPDDFVAVAAKIFS